MKPLHKLQHKAATNYVNKKDRPLQMCKFGMDFPAKHVLQQKTRDTNLGLLTESQIGMNRQGTARQSDGQGKTYIPPTQKQWLEHKKVVGA